MTANPYQSSQQTVNALIVPTPGRPLFWLSTVIVGLLLPFYVAVLLAGVYEYWKFHDEPEQMQHLAGILLAIGVYSLVVGLLGIPQYLSVFRRSLRAAKCTHGIARVGMWLSLLAVPGYPVFEYFANQSPKGSELLGFVFFSVLAWVFHVNRRLHASWITKLQAFAERQHEVGVESVSH